ncbi:hypothetical protein ACFU9B_39565 [Streptomyces sp. NPDC057592]|uniref:hypothetical protein n=1 Tax=unclassified Streptomyces TaxID=2593676 RepID=UPI00368D18D6
MTDTTARPLQDTADEPSTEWPGAVTGGCCATCPIRQGCALAAETYVVCPITGTGPPPAPPGRVPDQHLDMDFFASKTTDAADIDTATEVDRADAEPGGHTGTDWTDVAGRAAEGVAAAALGGGWIDIATGLIERFNREDADGNPVDWGRLQLKRNGLAILTVTLVPLGDRTAAQWVAHVLDTHTLTDALFGPVGVAFGVIAPVLVGQVVPGPFGAICRGLVKTAALVGGTVWQAARKFLSSGLGWIVARPAIWAIPCGLIVLTGRYFLRLFTGA